MVISTVEQELQNLEKFRELSANQKNHEHLLRDKKAILYAATLTDRQDSRIVTLCLDIFENFLHNDRNHVALITTFGVYESLEAVAIRYRNLDRLIFKRAAAMTDVLRNTAPPAFNTRSRKKAKSPTVFLLQVPQLSTETRSKFESTLVKIRGVVSFLIDLEVKRCTLRICPKVTIKEVVEKVFRKCALKCLIVKKDKGNGEESLYDILENYLNCSYLEYPEEEFLHQSRALTTGFDQFEPPKTGLMDKMKHFWVESFYW